MRAAAASALSVPARDDPFGNRGDLRGSFTKPKNDFGEALTNVAMGVHAREAEVFEGCGGECIANASGRGLCVDRAGAHVVQHLPQIGFSHAKEKGNS